MVQGVVDSHRHSPGVLLAHSETGFLTLKVIQGNEEDMLVATHHARPRPTRLAVFEFCLSKMLIAAMQKQALVCLAVIP